MDDSYFGIRFLLVMIACCLPGWCGAADLTYITPAQTKTLSGKFSTAQFRDADRARLTAHAWRCDMFGMRTRMQLQTDVNLYAFAPVVPTPGEFTNGGEQPIAKYVVHDGALEGNGPKGLLDQVKFTADGELIAKLSQPARGLTIAYAVCRKS